VTKCQRLAAVAGCLVVLSLMARGAPAQPPRGQGIALLDISYIFKNHTRFKAEMEAMRADMERAQATMNKEREAIQKLNEQLKGMASGTAEYRQLEQHVATRTADLNVQAQLQRKEFLLRETKIYHTVYKEVQQVVDYYAKDNGIGLVLRFNGDPVDPDDPEGVLRYINGDVIWYGQGMDITPVILERLNGRALTTDSREGVPRRPLR